MNKNQKIIELIGVISDKIYSLGYIKISKKGDIYHIYKIQNSDFHLSRHSDGKIFWTSKQLKFSHKIRDGKPIKEFKGIEIIGTNGFNTESLPELYTEYKMRKCNGIFAVDLREYKENTLNLALCILTKEGMNELYTIWEKENKKQVYLYTNSNPMIAIIIIGK